MPIDPGPTHEPSPAEVERAELLAMLQLCRVRMADELPPDEFLFEWAGKKFMPKDGIIALKAKAKSGKTFFLCLLAAAAIYGGDLQGLRWLGPSGAKVLFIDTEQRKASTIKVAKRIAAASRPDDERLILLNFVEVPQSKRLQALELAIQRYKPVLVIVDGIAQFSAYGYNDDASADELVTDFRKITTAYHTAIITAIHTNYNDNNATGWLGRRLLQNCDLELELQKHPGGPECTLKTAASRDYFVPDMPLSIEDTPDGLGKMVILSDAYLRERLDEREKERVIAFLREGEQLPKFEGSRADFIREISRVKGVSESTAKRWVGSALKFNILGSVKQNSGTTLIYNGLCGVGSWGQEGSNLGS